MGKQMKKFVIMGIGALALSACAPAVPDSGQGVGFNDYAEYELERARREAQLQGTPLPSGTSIVPPTASSGLPTPTTGNGPITTSELAAAGINTGPATPPVQAGLPSPAPARPIAANPEISDEQSFEAVASRESIESDAQRRERQAAAYQLIEPTALPVRNGVVEPNIVQYALLAPNDLGESVFERGGFNAQSRFQRNCAEYRTADEAQRDFLARGGPQRDRRGLDPDGDGFACGWDPQAFRSVAAGN